VDEVHQRGSEAASWLPTVAETSFGMVLAGVSVFFPPASIVAAASPVLGHAVRSLLQERALDGQEVFDDEGVTVEAVEQALESNAAMFDLGRETVEGILDARDRGQRRLLARALAKGVLDDAKVEPELRLVRTVSQLDVPDVLALKVLCEPRAERPSPEDPNGCRYADTVWPDEVRAEWGQQSLVVEEVMARLVGLGLAFDRGSITMDGLQHWHATIYGRFVFERLAAEGAPRQKA
jgi:hypothetical protein